MAKEDEKDKEEKVEEDLIYLENIVLKKSLEGRIDSYLTVPEAARIAQLPEVRAEVARQEEANRIGPGDWVVEKASRTVFCVADVITDDDGDVFLIGFPDLDNGHCEFRAPQCHKITDPELIAALNAEIDGKAGG